MGWQEKGREGGRRTKKEGGEGFRDMNGERKGNIVSLQNSHHLHILLTHRTLTSSPDSEDDEFDAESGDGDRRRFLLGAAMDFFPPPLMYDNPRLPAAAAAAPAARVVRRARGFSI